MKRHKYLRIITRVCGLSIPKNSLVILREGFSRVQPEGGESILRVAFLLSSAFSLPQSPIPFVPSPQGRDYYYKRAMPSSTPYIFIIPDTRNLELAYAQ
jgi:hypothetical protein